MNFAMDKKMKNRLSNFWVAAILLSCAASIFAVIYASAIG